ncbi:putative methyltransferase C9orf114 [Episyrphus balteatus]|uniref:putative methyltransferase C9orf114 n=1 Tax=Episyrphus balteatus TaxID=286459 RepID=UPI0024864BBA|nr:putative methyltransferase C9orf114 [Episyrphus balteatus]
MSTKPEQTKSWKKINEERKAIKKQRKQENILKQLEKANKLEELAKSAQLQKATETKKPLSTVSIAVPGSILENAQSSELRTYVAGQIARAACIFRVNEVIVFDDIGIATAKETKKTTGDDGQDQTVRGSSLQLARILQYLECPQYLRKFLFPLHKDLKYSGLLNPLDAPHHMRMQNVFLYREGVVSDKKAKEGHCYVNVGLLADVMVNKAISPGVRVTVRMDSLNEIKAKKMKATVVSPDEPRRETGIYWGYTVRVAHSFSEIFTKSPYKEGYDLTLGTSDRGTSVVEVQQKSLHYNHLLIVFGGLKGLEAAVANDDKLNVEPKLLFDHYLNVLPSQGSRTIRTEEAILIAMAALYEKFDPEVPDIKRDFEEFIPQSEETSMQQQVSGVPSGDVDLSRFD